MHDAAPAQVQVLGSLFQSAEGAFISQGIQRLVTDGPDILFGAGDGFRDVRPDGLRRKPRPGKPERRGPDRDDSYCLMYDVIENENGRVPAFAATAMKK
ncbi:hypothetical protein M5E88_19980 [Akkermansia muciniphila]|nr:hypothetical protein M5E88_19980 [Akkermansia muciniphila]